MKLRRISAFCASMLISLSSLMVFAPAAHAATVTWDGGGTDENFSTAENWVGDVAPVNGDSISIGFDTIYGSGCSADVTLNNDLDPGAITLAGIVLTGERPASCYRSIIIDGNNLVLSGGITASDDEDFGYVDLNMSTVTVTSPVTLENSTIEGLVIGANNVTMHGSYADTINGSGNLVLSGGGGGAGGCGPLTPSSFNNSNFSGSITIQDNSLTVDSNVNALARHASSITKSSLGSLGFAIEYGEDMSFDTPLTLNGGSMYANQFVETMDCDPITEKVTLTIESDVTFTAETTFYLYHVNVVFTGEVTGAQHAKVANTSAGTITIGDDQVVPQKFTTEYKANSPATTVYVNRNETAVLTGTYGLTTVGDGGTLKGTGTVGELDVNVGGTLAPGLSPGCLNSGNLTFVSGSTYEFEVGGATECTEYDQTKVTGTVDLGNGTLNLVRFNDFKPVAGQSYKIIDNDVADAVTGTFLNLAEGATFTVDGYVFKISYVGGDGNDVVVTVQSVPATPNTGFRMLTANPVITFATTTMLAVGIALLGRRYSKVTVR